MLVLLPLFLFFSKTTLAELPEVSRKVPEIISYYKYPVEIHYATTKDGYILELHRIPCGVKSHCQKGIKRRAIFLQHGLLGSSADWVLNTPDGSAGFIFADAGYDVWLGNMRGNRYSRNHTSLSVDSDAFWQFSFDQHAAYDLPGMLNYVLEKTGEEYLYYIGHSQGTLIAFIQFSVDPELASRVRIFFGFAPVVSTKRLKGLFRIISDITNGAQEVTKAIFDFVTNVAEEVATKVRNFFTGQKDRVEIEFNVFKAAFYGILGRGEFLASGKAALDFLKWICTLDLFFKLTCENMLFAIAGPYTDQSNVARQDAFLAHYPAGTSSRNILHWLQFVKRDGTPRKFDYDSAEKNQQVYGQPTPPDYDLTKLRTDRLLWSSYDDYLANPADLHAVFMNVRGVRMFTKMIYETNHLDFLYGKKGKNFSHEIINEIEKAEKSDVKYDRECYTQKKAPTSAECSKLLPPPDAVPGHDAKTKTKIVWEWPTTTRPQPRAVWEWPAKPNH